MALIVRPEDFLEKLVVATPQYGWGWSCSDGKEEEAVPMDFQQIHDAGAFHVRVRRFFSVENELRGFCGRVEEPNHIFDRLWIICTTRLRADYDFRDNPALGYDFEIAPSEPLDAEWPKPKGSPLHLGYGTVKV